MADKPNMRIKLARQRAAEERSRGARSLCAVRWAHVTEPWREPMLARFGGCRDDR